MEPVLTPAQPVSQTPQPTVMIGEGNKRIIIVPRDYSEGELCQFSTAFPKELEGKIDPQVLRKAVDEINSVLRDAESINRHHVLESLVGCLTCYISYLFITSYYQKCLIRLRKYLEDENEKSFLPKGLLIRDPAETALQHLEIIITR